MAIQISFQARKSDQMIATGFSTLIKIMAKGRRSNRCYSYKWFMWNKIGSQKPSQFLPKHIICLCKVEKI